MPVLTSLRQEPPDDSGAPARGAPMRVRRPYRPPIGIPMEKQGKGGAVASFVLHALVIFLIIAPPLFSFRKEIQASMEGAGGPGPAGGGGGGNRGTGGVPRERMQFLQVAPTPPAPQPTTVPQLAPPKPVEAPQPKPPEVKPVEPTPPPTAAAPTDTGKATGVASVVPGAGGGSGTDGSAGSGPGSGGGVGSGVGTGRGSGTGPGTGGGNAVIYPPTVTALPILPLPVPGKVRPYKMVAYFDVDTLGHATLLSFNPSKDNGYNKRIREMLLEIRFRPAVRGLDGRAVRDTAVITAEAP